MHVANLQLEGLLMAIASVNNVLVRKGMLSVQEIDEALAKVETGLMADEHVTEDMSASNRDAVCFPIRFLKLANLGLDAALAADPHLAKGLNVRAGKITHPAVAEALGLAAA